MASCWNDNRLHKDVRSQRDSTDMDQVWKIKESEGKARLRTLKPDKANKVKAKVLPPIRNSNPRIVTSFEDGGVSGDEDIAHEAELVHLNLKPSSMGVLVCDEEDQFFSRQSSMSSMISDKFRSGIACISCGSDGQQERLVDSHGKKRGTSDILTSASSCASKGEKSGIPLAETGSHVNENGIVSHIEKPKVANSTLYPSRRLGDSIKSSIPDSSHSTLGTSGTRHTTDRVLKHRLRQSRLQKCSDTGVESMQNISRDNAKIQGNNGSAGKLNKRSSLSAADPRVSCPAALTFSERLFGYEFSRDPSQRLCQPDTKCAPSTQTGTNEWQHSLHPGRCSISIHAMSDYDDTDEDDIIIEDDVIFQISNALAIHCSQEQHADPATGVAKRRPSVERWSSNRKSFNLDLEHIPVRTLSINVNESKHHQSFEPGRLTKTRTKLDVSQRDISLSSVNSSVDGGSRRLKIGALDSFASERSGWLDFESELNDFVLNPGRLKMDMTHEPDLDKPDLEQVKNGLNKFHDDRAKMDEAAFPFNSPVASSFLFGNDGAKCPKDAHQQHLTISISSIPRILVPEMDLDMDDFEHSDAYHDPDDIDADDGSMSDTNSSLTTFSLEAVSNGGLIDTHPQWVSSRSFKYVRDVVDHNSGYLDIECQSGRFSVDLRRDKRLDKADHVSRPAMRLSMLKTQKTSSRRSLLSPCLPFLHREKNISRPQRPIAASRSLLLTAQLGSIEKDVPKLRICDSFTARLSRPAETASKLQSVNSFTARLGPQAS